MVPTPVENSKVLVHLYVMNHKWFIVGMKEVMGINHEVNGLKSVTIFLDDNGAVLVR